MSISYINWLPVTVSVECEAIVPFIILLAIILVPVEVVLVVIAFFMAFPDILYIVLSIMEEFVEYSI